ncbi:MAG TPA: DUF475 domain-containing protein [Gammaproteobacteria bacterium]|nr:DUF475 domain-containing protein [Gammaproteobacteria bacterium]
MKHFKASIFITLFGLSAAFLWGGIHALVLTLILSVLEISLSFDNAVLNSSVLQKMDTLWRHRFLTWGILIAVFVVRFLLPIIIVGFVTHLSLSDVFFLAIQKPSEYAKLLEATKTTISSFGGIFLLLVFLSFLFDQKRDIHWLGRLEKKLNAIGKIKALHIILALVVLIGIQASLPEQKKLGAIIAGSFGIILFVILNSLTTLLNRSVTKVKHSGLIQFLYLEVLDTSFSLDGVIGAFAITKDIVIILIGLTIGAIFVRSLTLFLVYKGTLSKYRFLEHGAHYAIGALAMIMLISTKTHVSEIITGLIGVSFIGLSLLSSIRHNRQRGET